MKPLKTILIHSTGKLKVFLTLSLCLLILSSCVTLLGKKTTIQVDSTPQGAKVYAGNKYIGTTPLSYRSKKAASTLTFEKDGYSTKTIYTSTSMRNSIWWNMLFTGFFGVLADFPYWEKYDATSYYTKLSVPEKPKPVIPEPVVPQPTMPMVQRATASTLSRIVTSKKATEMRGQDVFKKYDSAVFMIFTSDESSTGQGSGFFVSSSGIGVSNYHVFAGTLKGKEIIKLIDGRTYKVKEVLGYSKEYDYIIFQVDGDNFNYIPITKRGYEVGDAVYTISSPKGLANTFSPGTISQDRNDYLIQINAPIDHGSSGGALINSYGEAIGITTGGVDSSGANLNFAIDIRAIYDYIAVR